METLAKVLVALVAIEHIYILILEMFLWTKPRTIKVFGLTPEFAKKTKALAANQGLYNGFLAAGLFWGLSHNNLAVGFQLQVFFLLCIIIAAIYGSLTVNKSIILIQGLPAIVALMALMFGGLLVS